MIEEGALPHDAVIVGQTWRFTNRDGGPDRRFANNPQLPIVQYRTIQLTSAGGMNHTLYVSSEAAATEFANRLRHMTALQDAYIRPLALPTQIQEAIDAESIEEVEVESEETSTKAGFNVFEAVLDSLCCMMFADGVAHPAEREEIHALMERVKAPWSSSEVEDRMRDFYGRAKTAGFNETLAETVQELSRVKSPKQQKAIRKCLNAVARADGKIDERELNVRDMLVAAFDTTRKGTV